MVSGQTSYAANFGDSQSQPGVPDFNFDGRPDYLRLVSISPHQTRVMLDLMTAGGVGSSQTVGDYDPTLRRPVGVGDFDRDGHLDLLFQDQVGGATRFWSLRRGAFVADKFLANMPAGERVVEVLDLDHKGLPDLLLRNRATGGLTGWMMDGSAAVTTRSLGAIADEQVVEGSADIDGDGREDIVIRDGRSGGVKARLIGPGLLIQDIAIGTLATPARLVGVESGANGASRFYWQDDATGAVTSSTRGSDGAYVAGVRQEALSRVHLPGRYLSLEAADTPLLVNLANRDVVRGSTVAFVAGRNAAASGLALRYSLGVGAPAGAAIDPVTGAFSWSTPADLAPGSYSITIIVDAPDAPGLSDSRSFVVRVSVESAAPFVEAVYAQVLGRQPSQGELTAFAGRIEAGTPRSDVVGIILSSPEARGVRVDALYRTYLHRPATPRERAKAIASLQRAGGDDALILSLVTSRDYVKANPTTRAFVTSLYRDALGRSPTAGEIASWSRLPRRSSIARGILTSREARGRVVDQSFQAILGRSASTIEREGWIFALRSGGADRDALRRSLLSSDEFYRKVSPVRP